MFTALSFCGLLPISFREARALWVVVPMLNIQLTMAFVQNIETQMQYTFALASCCHETSVCLGALFLASISLVCVDLACQNLILHSPHVCIFIESSFESPMAVLICFLFRNQINIYIYIHFFFVVLVRCPQKSQPDLSTCNKVSRSQAGVRGGVT